MMRIIIHQRNKNKGAKAMFLGFKCFSQLSALLLPVDRPVDTAPGSPLLVTHCVDSDLPSPALHHQKI